MTPIPVTATRRVILEQRRLQLLVLFGGEQLFDSVHHFANRFDLHRLVVGNRNVELVLDGEQNVHAVQRIEFQIRESLVDGDGFRRQVLGLRNHLDRAGG